MFFVFQEIASQINYIVSLLHWDAKLVSTGGGWVRSPCCSSRALTRSEHQFSHTASLAVWCSRRQATLSLTAWWYVAARETFNMVYHR